MSAEESRQNVFRINALQIKENERKGPKLHKLPNNPPPVNGHKDWWTPHR